MNKEINYNTAEKTVIILIAVIIGLIVTAGLIFLFAAVCLAADLSDAYSTLISGICLGSGALVSGLLAGKKIGKGGAVIGALCGAALYLVIFFFSLFISEGGFSVITLSHALISIIASAIGGVLGVNVKGRRKLI